MLVYYCVQTCLVPHFIGPLCGCVCVSEAAPVCVSVQVRERFWTLGGDLRLCGAAHQRVRQVNEGGPRAQLEQELLQQEHHKWTQDELTPILGTTSCPLCV